MVNNTALDSVFAALADPVRRRIIHQLSAGRSPVGRLARSFSISAPAISRHLRVLESASLIRRTKIGRIHEIELAPESLRPAAHWLDLYRRHWEANLDSLARYLESETAAPISFPATNQKPDPSSNQSNP
jgi:DNA-binding transcriptional ArsR family regulator